MTAMPGHGLPARGAGYLLASTADRERAVDVLKAGFVEGRLTKDEYDTRTHHALNARTLGDLAVITADLPGGAAAAPVWPVPVRTNTLAVAALACGLGQPFTAFLSTIPAIVLGHLARREIRRTGERGAGLATAGLTLGWIGASVLLLIALLIVAAVAMFRSAG